MAISPYIVAMREHVGRDLLLLPSVAVIPRDEQGRVLLVRQIDSGRWATIGGLVEIDEDPGEAGRREAREEASVDVALVRLLAALGGPRCRETYSNGDEAAYVIIVYEAKVVSEAAAAHDGEETSAVGWFQADEIPSLELGPLNRYVLEKALSLMAHANE